VALASLHLKQIIPRNEFVAEIRFPCFRSPVYRGHDIGAAFNEDYVDPMHRLALGRTEQLTLGESDTRWVATLDGGGCASIDVSTIPHDPTVSAVAPVRAANTICEALAWSWPRSGIAYRIPQGL
jgi:hypothetical protein